MEKIFQIKPFQIRGIKVARIGTTEFFKVICTQIGQLLKLSFMTMEILRISIG